MLKIDPVSLGRLAIYLSQVDAADQARSDALSALEAAASKKNNEPSRLSCLEALRESSEAYDGALVDLAEEVRLALYGPPDDDEEFGDHARAPRYEEV